MDATIVARAAAIADAWEAFGHGPAVPAYASVVLAYDPERLSGAAAEDEARRADAQAGDPGHRHRGRGRPADAPGGETQAVAVSAATVAMNTQAVPPAPRLVPVPTRYDGEDLSEVARMSDLAVAELVALHSSREYTVFFLGFMPGFAYLGTLDPRIRAPRLASPRARVPTGAVAVADGQTAIYPFASPGGWRLIGHTDFVPFDATADPPAALRAGDRVRFVPL